MKIVVFICMLALGTILFNAQKNDAKVSSLSMYNIEALSDDNEESSGSDYWCCGHSNKCAHGPNYEIIGKLSSDPC